MMKETYRTMSLVAILMSLTTCLLMLLWYKGLSSSSYVQAKEAEVELIEQVEPTKQAGQTKPIEQVEQTEPPQSPTPTTPPSPTPTATKTSTPESVSAENGITVHIDINEDVHSISPLIYGLSGGSLELMQALQISNSSWGGNPSTRYNWSVGNAWNTGSDWEYRNTNYGSPEELVSIRAIEVANEEEIEFRMAIPTLGWVAKNDDPDTCSFPLPDGDCGDGNGSSCENPRETADPTLANVESTPQDIIEWMQYIKDRDLSLRFIAMDNEPELWGYTHYDVHPTCTTYDEILQKHIEYATAVRSVMPEVEITGPATCCWWFYWNSAAGYADKQAHGDQDFLPWFLDRVKEYDEENDIQTLNVLDIHYYPERVYNDDIDPDTAALRLRSTRSLWDKNYPDESWISQPIALIPTMKDVIAEHYPELKLGISEWNFGADGFMNGALAIADVLGIFGREDLYFANYWRNPKFDSPGFHAFKMFTNYDDDGGAFGDTSVQAQSDNLALLSSYAALDSETGNLHIMLVSKGEDEPITVTIDVGDFEPRGVGAHYLYAEAIADRIVSSGFSVGNGGLVVTLPAYSISHLILTPTQSE